MTTETTAPLRNSDMTVQQRLELSIESIQKLATKGALRADLAGLAIRWASEVGALLTAEGGTASEFQALEAPLSQFVRYLEGFVEVQAKGPEFKRLHGEALRDGLTTRSQQDWYHRIVEESSNADPLKRLLRELERAEGQGLN